MNAPHRNIDDRVNDYAGQLEIITSMLVGHERWMVEVRVLHEKFDALVTALVEQGEDHEIRITKLED